MDSYFNCSYGLRGILGVTFSAGSVYLSQRHGFTSVNVVSSSPAHGKAFSIQHHVIKVCQWLAAGEWFFPGTPVFSSNKTDNHYITEILLKVVINTITLTSSRCDLIIPLISSMFSYNKSCNKWTWTWSVFTITNHSSVECFHKIHVIIKHFS